MKLFIIILFLVQSVLCVRGHRCHGSGCSLAFVPNDYISSSPILLSYEERIQHSHNRITNCQSIQSQKRFKSLQWSLSSISSSSSSSTSTTSSLWSKVGDSFDSTQSSSSSLCTSEVNIVLMGVGDLRVDDHGGFYAAICRKTTLSLSSSRNSQSTDSTFLVPMIILSDDIIGNIPGIVAHTIDTVDLLVNSIHDVDLSIKNLIDPNLHLHVIGQGYSSVQKCLNAVISEIKQKFVANMEAPETTIREGTVTTGASTTTTEAAPPTTIVSPMNVKIRVHVCDLGDADNDIGYGPYGQLRTTFRHKTSNSVNDDAFNDYELVTWKQCLRMEPWDSDDTVRNIPTTYPEYVKKYAVHTSSSIPPLDITTLIPSSASSSTSSSSVMPLTLDHYQRLPSKDELLEYVVQSLKKKDDGTSREDFNLLIQSEQCTGLFRTHWGGLPSESIRGSAVMESVNAFVNECQQDDALWIKHPCFVKTTSTNPRSLEHAAMKWQLSLPSSLSLSSDSDSSTSSTSSSSSMHTDQNEECNVNNWMKGELMTRYLAAPLLFGTISPRRLWHMANNNNENNNRFPWLQRFLSLSSSPITEIVEGGEWHRLLAARNIRTKATGSFGVSSSMTTAWKYWRYQGFLCRYILTVLDDCNQLKEDSGSSNHMEKYDDSSTSSIILVHGFGASGEQWTKTMMELGKQISKTHGRKKNTSRLGLAPDLLGFGHSEKPGISYTGYLWDAQLLDFCKEIAIHKYKTESFITGGNSIGGFASLSFASSDASPCITKNDKHDNDSGSDRNVVVVSSSGAPGTQRCAGLVLMNSAGPIKTRIEIEEQTTASTATNVGVLSIAQRTVLGKLEPCQPPPRIIARSFGNGLLWYLRPRIQSICKNLYPTNPSAVDDKLCDSILRDSLDPGAIYVMMAGAKLPTPRTANELLNADFGGSIKTPRTQIDLPFVAAETKKIQPNQSFATSLTSVTAPLMESTFDGPVLIAQGVLDPLNDAKDRMNRFKALRNGISVSPIQAGHCPHDERPDLVAESIVSWMNQIEA